MQTDGQFDYAASLVKSLASLLVVTSGSAIGREGAMILLAALAASCFAQRFTPRQEWKLWIACGAAAGMAAAYSRPACWQFIYSRSAVWHYDVGLSAR
ncbi:chloride channel protein [Escherichia coli]